MESVAFYSYKGGVGRSLLLVNTARFLALSGRRVVALDLDFEAPGLHYKTGVEGKVETGAVRLLQRSLDGDLPSIDEVREATVEVPMPATHGGWLRVLAAGPAPKTEYWADLSRLHEMLVANQDAGLLEAVLDLQARIEDAWNPDVLLVDARTGVTGLGGIATMALCDRVVLMTTRARESLDGIRAVADSLRATPTLRGGERRLEYVVSRVQGTEAVDEQELRDALGEYFRLPHDRFDGGAERLLGDGSLPPAVFSTPTDRSFTHSLLAQILTWISKLFPIQADVAIRARKRLVAVEEAWRELTDIRRNSPGGQARESWRWSTSMLAANVTFSGSDGSARTADIVAKLKNGELAMIIEHFDDEPGPEAAHWWSEHVPVQVIVLQWNDGTRPVKRKMFSRGRIAWVQSADSTDRRGLPSPIEFELLRDPTDRSIETMLEVAPLTSLYDESLIEKWERGMAVSIYGRAGPRPEQARKILDGLTRIEDVQRVAQVAWKCTQRTRHHSLYVWDDAPDDYLDRLVLEGLCASLCWRTPPQALIELAGAPYGPTPAFYALRRLASFMGLDYDPNAAFRREALGLVGEGAGIDVVHMAEAFQARELQPEWLDEGASLGSKQYPRPLGYHGYLGSYIAATGRIVLAGATIEAVAKSLGRAPRHVGSVTLLHLSVLGMLHNGIDLDGQRWEGFPTDELSPATIALAQFFEHRFLAELADERLEDAFEALSDSQPPEYGAWRAMTHLSLEAGRAWMMSIRRGTGEPAPVDLDALLQPR